MSTPIFDRLNAERDYNSLVNWEVPAFLWFRPVVQLDKKPVNPTASEVRTLGGAPYGGPTQE